MGEETGDRMKTTTSQTAYASSNNLTGSCWMAHDGLCTVGERMPSGMYRVTRACGRTQQMRPEFIESAMAKASADLLALSDAAMAMDL
jgi:hypothetical protein